MEATQQSSGRGKAFSPAKDVTICKAWSRVTQDRIVGNSQNG